RQGAPLLAFERLRLDLADVRPLQRVVHLGGVELDAPVLHAARDAAGQLNLAQLAAPGAAPAPGADQAPAPQAAASVPAAQRAPAWAVRVDRAAVQGGTVHWADAGTRPAAALQATGVALQASGITLPVAQPIPFSGAL